MTAALAELERVARYAQVTRKLLPEWAPRPLMPWEVKAGVNFAEVDASLKRGYARTADILAELQRALVASLAGALDGASDGKVIAARVAAWVQDPPDDVAQAKAQAKAGMQTALVDCANRSGDQLRRSAALQGVAPTGVVKAAAGEANPADLVDEAALPVEALAGQVTQAAAMASQRPSSPDAPVTAADNASTSGAEDLARQGVHIAAGEGRSAAADELPTPSEIYASELLDGATCDPCASIDGTQYDTVDDAEADYPGQGPYVDCDGGARCRGTLVLVWDETAAVDQPAPQGAPAEPAPEPTPTTEPVAAINNYDGLRHALQRSLPQLDNPDDILDAARETNPGIATGRDVYRINCQKTTATYEMRRRGVAVTAAAGQGGPTGTTGILTWFKDPNGRQGIPQIVNKIGSPQAVTSAERMAKAEAAIEKTGPVGSRGALLMHWQEGGQHILNWERTADTVLFVDGQTGRVVGDSAWWEHAIADRVFRLDDMALTNASAFVT